MNLKQSLIMSNGLRRKWTGACGCVTSGFISCSLGKAKLEDVLQASVKNMEVFLNYREKYYGIPAQNEKQLLWGYQG